ncbi:MAG TPA: 2TM domain-containing protein [Flavobacterium sp.]|jgi:hypothetical protein|nr:2TM domain-containing protein [Flavobacterium sp.]HPJ09649.1 2TM domain-containing protein [Flavobacterium sp.]
METIENFERKQAEDLVRKRVKAVRNLYIHLCIYAVGVAIYIAKRYYGVQFFRPVGDINTFIMVIWTVIVVMDIVKVLVVSVVFGKKWEARKIKELTQNKEQKQIWK